MGTRRWGPGERIVFEPYTKETLDGWLRWIAAYGMFPDGTTGSGNYAQSIIRFENA